MHSLSVLTQVATSREGGGLGARRRRTSLDGPDYDDFYSNEDYSDGQGTDPDSYYDNNVTPSYTLEDVNQLIQEAQDKEAARLASLDQAEADKERAYMISTYLLVIFVLLIVVFLAMRFRARKQKKWGGKEKWRDSGSDTDWDDDVNLSPFEDISLDDDFDDATQQNQPRVDSAVC